MLNHMEQMQKHMEPMGPGMMHHYDAGKPPEKRPE